MADPSGSSAVGPALLDHLLTRPGRLLLTGPSSPDGDSLGASLALGRVLRRHGVEATVCADAPRRYRWLPGVDGLIPTSQVGTGWDTVVVLDGDRDRLPRGVQAAWDEAAVRGIVDHHASSTADGYDLVWIEPEATSTCGMLHEALIARGEALDPALATLLHTGEIFDTGGLRYDNTTPATLRRCAERVEHGVAHAAITRHLLAERRWVSVQALGEVLVGAERRLDGALILARVPTALRDRLGLDHDDLEGFVDLLADVDESQVAALLIDRGPGVIKVSLRSRGPVDVCAVARALTPTGGGHVKAAGAVVEEAPDALADRITAAVRAALG